MTPQTPADTVIHVVGDIHGRLDLLHRIQQCIVDDAKQRTESCRQVVYLGDYVSRDLAARIPTSHLDFFHALRISHGAGAYRSGVLTCLVLAGGTRDFLQILNPLQPQPKVGADATASCTRLL